MFFLKNKELFLRKNITVIPQDDGFMDCWIIGFEFKKKHRYWILRQISE
jgi:hypothetical protein